MPQFRTLDEQEFDLIVGNELHSVSCLVAKEFLTSLRRGLSYATDCIYIIDESIHVYWVYCFQTSNFSVWPVHDLCPLRRHHLYSFLEVIQFPCMRSLDCAVSLCFFIMAVMHMSSKIYESDEAMLNALGLLCWIIYIHKLPNDDITFNCSNRMMGML